MGQIGGGLMARIFWVGIIMAVLSVVGCNKNQEDLKAIEKEASTDDAGTVIDSLQGKSQTPPADVLVGATAMRDSTSPKREETPVQAADDSSALTASATPQSEPAKASEQPAEPAARPSQADVLPDVQQPASEAVDVLPGEFTVVVGSYADKKFAESVASKYQAEKFPAFVREITLADKTVYRLCVGSYKTLALAREAAENVKSRFSCDYWIDRGK
jgi:cell division protein FtsN